MKYYRVEIYDGAYDGYFNYLKNYLSKEDWNKFKKSNLAIWLPEVPKKIYNDNDAETWFTTKGFYKFIKHFKIYRDLVGHDIIISTVENLEKHVPILYKDEYQVVISCDPNEWAVIQMMDRDII